MGRLIPTAARLRIGFVLVLVLAAPTWATGAAAVKVVTTERSASAERIPSDFAALSADERQAVIAQLTDSEVRELLLRSWSAAQATTSARGAMTDNLGIFRDRFAELIANLPRLPEFFSGLWRVLVPESMSTGQVTVMLVCVALVFVFGTIVERIYSRLTGPLHSRLASTPARSFTLRLGLRLGNLIVKLIGIVIAAVAAIGALLALHPGEEPLRQAVLVYIGATLAFRVFRALAVFLFKPIFSDPRLIPLSDEDADQVYRLSLWAGGYWAFVFPLAAAIYVPLIASHPQLERLLGHVYGFITGVIFIAMLIVFVWRVRKPFAGLMLSMATGRSVAAWLCAALAQVWHVLLILIVLGIYVAAVYTSVVTGKSTGPSAFGTLAIVLFTPLFGVTLQKVLTEYFSARARRRVESVEPSSAEEAGAEAADEAPAVQPERPSGLALMASRISWMLLVLIALTAIGTLWGVDIIGFADNSIGSKVMYALFNILVAIVLANIAWVLISRAMEPYIPEEEDTAGPMEDIGGTGASRISTLMPLFRKFVLIALVIVTLMVVLSSLGVDIGPLIAGAGVIGLAIGFGAQTLVRDIISGVFFLMDDAFRKGEYISIGDIKGVVERISIRSFQLRHHNGPVHTVPYGEITSLTNFSRDWAIMKFELRVPFETDVDKVRKLIKKLGQEMMEDPELSKSMIEPLKSQGVNRMDDSALIVRCKFTAKPGQQFTLRREAFTRIQRMFEEQGLTFAPKRVIVETASSGRAEQAAAAAGAAVASEPELVPAAGAGDDRG